MSEEEQDSPPTHVGPLTGSLVMGVGEAAVLPGSPKVTRWRDAERDPLHRPLDVGPTAVCSCGWSGSGWTQHYLSVTEKR